MHGPEVMATVTPDSGMQETMLKMSEKGFGIACVVQEGVLASLI